MLTLRRRLIVLVARSKKERLHSNNYDRAAVYEYKSKYIAK